MTLSVCSLLGQTVSTLVQDVRKAGYQDVQFDKSELASGVYYVRIQAGSLVDTRRAILLK